MKIILIPLILLLLSGCYDNSGKDICFQLKDEYLTSAISIELNNKEIPHTILDTDKICYMQKHEEKIFEVYSYVDDFYKKATAYITNPIILEKTERVLKEKNIKYEKQWISKITSITIFSQTEESYLKNNKLLKELTKCKKQ